MTNLNWPWLQNRCNEFLAEKCTDPNAMKSARALRVEAYAKGFSSEQVSKAMHRCREILDEK